MKSLNYNGRMIKLTKQIGVGSFAYVYDTNTPDFVVKQMRIQNSDQLVQAFKEVQYQTLCAARNNVRIYAVYLEKRQLDIDDGPSAVNNIKLPVYFSLLMEKCEDSVMNLVNQPSFLPQEQITQVLIGTLQGLHAIHSHNIYNRDIKLENLLFRNKNNYTADNVRICDFGSSTSVVFTEQELILNSNLRSVLQSEIQDNTTPQYRAPELIDLLARLPITEKVDIFAFGVLVFRLMYKCFPFTEDTLSNFNAKFQFPDETQKVLMRSKYDEPLNIPKYSLQLKDFVRKCLSKDPRQRPNTQELLQMLGQQISQNVEFGAKFDESFKWEPVQKGAQIALVNKKSKQFKTASTPKKGGLLSSCQAPEAQLGEKEDERFNNGDLCSSGKLETDVFNKIQQEKKLKPTMYVKASKAETKGLLSSSELDWTDMPTQSHSAQPAQKHVQSNLNSSYNQPTQNQPSHQQNNNQFTNINPQNAIPPPFLPNIQNEPDEELVNWDSAQQLNADLDFENIHKMISAHAVEFTEFIGDQFWGEWAEDNSPKEDDLLQFEVQVKQSENINENVAENAVENAVIVKKEEIKVETFAELAKKAKASCCAPISIGNFIKSLVQKRFEDALYLYVFCTKNKEQIEPKAIAEMQQILKENQSMIATDNKNDQKTLLIKQISCILQMCTLEKVEYFMHGLEELNKAFTMLKLDEMQIYKTAKNE
ncbi:Kinase [Hexamita inflata]|uniref:non-specific serine/threonine protein kinase n=1 Tax=Hexamita inflata TaxID=28002 RepID=A0AA86Q138_9EUKA|nr:Kinase [Hexamita inflata]